MSSSRIQTKSPNKLGLWFSNYFHRVPFTEKTLFIHNLYIMIKAGLSIVEALRILAEQMSNKKLRQAVVEIKAAVEQGHQLSEVLADYPYIFPPMYVNMIAAGEVAGKMQEALFQVHEQMKKSHELFSRIRGALIYPAVVIVAMTGIGVEMVFFVLPKIVVLFNDFNVKLPLPTRILIGLINGGERYGIFILIGLVILIMALAWLIRQPKIKRMIHALNLRLPIAGTIIKKINLANFTMTLSSLLSSTIPIIDAVRITASVQTNVLYREDLLAAAEALKRGQPLSEILARFPARFTPMVLQMIMVGEQSGAVEQMLSELADYYSNEVDTTMKNFSTIIEPVIILVLGLAVAGIAVAVVMPMYSLAQSF